MDHWFRAHGKLAVRVTLGALVSTLAISIPRPSSADHETEEAWTEVMVGAFDDATGVPVMGKLLTIMKAQESLSYSPEVLDQRLRAVEEHLQQIDARLQQVAIRVGQLQTEAVRNANTDRLRELQRIRGEIVLVSAGLRNNPNAFERSQLTLKAEQMADQLKDSPNFDIWQWTDIDPATNLRTRFEVLPSFELYSLALITWFSALEVVSETAPATVVRDYGAALSKHATFLRSRPGWKEGSDPLTLPEHLRAAVFCELETSQLYVDQNGKCSFAQVCYDNLDDKKSQPPQTVVISIQAFTPTTACTWDPNREMFFDTLDDLRNGHGLALMDKSADLLERLATTGTSKTQFIGSFTGPVDHAAFFLGDWALESPSNPASGGKLVLAAYTNVNRFDWTIDSNLKMIRNDANNQCLDVQDNTPVSGASVILWPCNNAGTQRWEVNTNAVPSFNIINKASNLCATKGDLPPHVIGGPLFNVNDPRPVFLSQCANLPTQQFSTRPTHILGAPR
jgi:Ricin-type beta-trefoil lectin domain-like